MKTAQYTAAFIVLLMGSIFAQDFGYEYYSVLDYRTLGINYSFQDFQPRSSNSLPDSQRIRFTSNLPFIEYRELGLLIGVGYQTYSIARTTKSSISVYAESANDLSVSGKADRSGFFIPVIVSANYVKAESGIFGAKHFDVGSLGIGTGLKYRYFSRLFGAQAFGSAAFHYATEGFSVEYGSSWTYTGELQFILPDAMFSGLVVGYRYEWQGWNMSNASFDYRRYFHGPFIGIMF